MATKSNPATTNSLDDFILEGANDELTYHNFSITRKTNYAEFADSSLIDLYLPELKSICLDIPIENITKAQIARYRYQPDILAYDIYGSTQLDFIVLICNGIIDPKEFDFKIKSLQLPKASNLMELLSEIYRSESDWIDFRDK